MTGSAPGQEPDALGAVAGLAGTQRPWVAFCARCGVAPSEAKPGWPQAFSRVCACCGMGLVLRAPEEVAPAAGEAFLVADRALAVCAVSETAEPSLGITEPFAIGRLVTEVLVPEGDPADERGLVMLIRRALLDGGAPQRTDVRVAGDELDVVRVRVGPCGPPRAALIVLEA